MIELKLGKMTGQELAEWLGIKYNTYRKDPKKYVARLAGYCTYEPVRGGAIIQSIMFPIYRGELSEKIVKDYCAEVKENQISSAVGMARKFKYEQRQEYADIKVDTLRRSLSQVGKVCFGDIQQQGTYDDSKRGAMGYRYGRWVVKVDDYNHYRPMTEEEHSLFHDIIKGIYSSNPEKIEEAMGLELDLKNGDFTLQEFFEEKEKRGLNLYGECLREFREQTGLVLARCSEHYFSSPEGAF